MIGSLTNGALSVADVLDAPYLSQFALGLRQRPLFLLQLGFGGVQLGPLRLHHPVDSPINLGEGPEISAIIGTS